MLLSSSRQTGQTPLKRSHPSLSNTVLPSALPSALQGQSMNKVEVVKFVGGPRTTTTRRTAATRPDGF
jgi:hypothetical protein